MFMNVIIQCTCKNKQHIFLRLSSGNIPLFFVMCILSIISFVITVFMNNNDHFRVLAFLYYSIGHMHKGLRTSLEYRMRKCNGKQQPTDIRDKRDLMG